RQPRSRSPRGRPRWRLRHLHEPRRVMAAPNLDLDRAADVLFDAAFMPDRDAAEKHGLTRQTVIRYRKRLDPKDPTYTPELVQLVTARVRQVRDAEWEANLPATLKAA